jgi:hypothetical protein
MRILTKYYEYEYEYECEYKNMCSDKRTSMSTIMSMSVSANLLDLLTKMCEISLRPHAMTCGVGLLTT